MAHWKDGAPKIIYLVVCEDSGDMWPHTALRDAKAFAEGETWGKYGYVIRKYIQDPRVPLSTLRANYITEGT